MVATVPIVDPAVLCQLPGTTVDVQWVSPYGGLVDTFPYTFYSGSDVIPACGNDFEGSFTNIYGIFGGADSNDERAATYGVVLTYHYWVAGGTTIQLPGEPTETVNKFTFDPNYCFFPGNATN
ncbi:MAG: hypothetical protein C0631_07575 [Sedimenticola sp.]|nr:MAG: hypothetical protein C0631_07575 [Sedimenticola sp.]